MEIISYKGKSYQLVENPHEHACTDCFFSYNESNNCTILESMDNKGTDEFLAGHCMVNLCKYGIKRFDKFELFDRKVLSCVG
jgi:hypothetical protein